MSRYRRSPLVTGHTAAARAEAAWMADMALEVPANVLTAAQKQAVWAHLKAHHPERVAVMQDTAFRALQAATGAVPTFPRAIVDAALHPHQQRSSRHAA